jgi:hypothetical protein
VREGNGSAVLATYHDAELKIKTESVGESVVRIEIKITKDNSKIQYSARAR